MTKPQQLADLGQSIWYDNIRRALLDSGGLQALVEAGVTGVTSNASIFEKAIAGSADYDQALGDKQALLDAGRRVIRFHLGADVVGGLKELTEGLV